MNTLQVLLRTLAREPAVLVTVARTQGSAPREVGAWMAVTPAALIGTIGGGQLEFEACARARAMLGEAPAQGLEQPHEQRYPLGPSLGQCCGGVVHLRFERLGESDIDGLQARLAPLHRLNVALFGGGHVGRAIVQLLGGLPAQVLWVDSRDEIFPADLPAQVRAEHSDPVQAAVADLPAGAKVLIMSFSHAEDLDVVAACLQRQRERADLAFIGLIGSRSKWAAFSHRLQARGFSVEELTQVCCPIGVVGIQGKQPELIALAAVAQLFQGWAPA